jgi:hypothetical protein
MGVLIGAKKYNYIPLLALVIFANPHGLGGSVENCTDPSVQTAAKADSAALAALTERQQKAVENGAPMAHVVRLSGANHYVFLSNEKDVLREMRSFLAELRWQLRSARSSSQVDPVSVASREQYRGIEQMAVAMSQMESVTQQTAASAEEGAVAAEQHTGQSASLKDVVDRLAGMVGDDSKLQPLLGFFEAGFFWAETTRGISARSGWLRLFPDKVEHLQDWFVVTTRLPWAHALWPDAQDGKRLCVFIAEVSGTYHVQVTTPSPQPVNYRLTEPGIVLVSM